MARGDKAWDYQNNTTVLSSGSPVLATPILSNPEGQVTPEFKCLRVIGHVNASLDLLNANVTRHVWLGVHLGSLDVGATTIFPFDAPDDDANEEAWLWREPFCLAPCGLHVLDTTVDKPVIIDWKFDWPMRGGRGTTIGVGQVLTFVLGCRGLSAETLFLGWTLLVLFSGPKQG